MPAFDTTDDFIWMGIRYLEIYLVNIASPAAKLSGFGLLDFRSGNDTHSGFAFCYPSLGPILSLDGIVFRGLSM